MCFIDMAFGRAWQHSKYCYVLWESFAVEKGQAVVMLRTFNNTTNREVRRIASNVRIWGPNIPFSRFLKHGWHARGAAPTHQNPPETTARQPAHPTARPPDRLITGPTARCPWAPWAHAALGSLEPQGPGGTSFSRASAKQLTWKFFVGPMLVF